MATSNASFNSFEEIFLGYLANGGTQGYTAVDPLPGMTVNPVYPGAYIRLCKTDPRSSIVYPNAFCDAAGVNSSFEPSSAEWDTYNYVVKNRYPTQWEVYEITSGQWAMRNLHDIAYVAPTGGTGCTLRYALWCLPSIDAALHYGILVAELDAPIVIPSGGGGSAPTILTNTLIFEAR